MVLPALGQAAVELGWGTLPWHIGWADRRSVEQPPLSCFFSALGLCCLWDSVFVQVAARAAAENRFALACFPTSDSTSLHLSVSIGRALLMCSAHLTQCCNMRPWEHVVCICGGKVPLAGDKRGAQQEIGILPKTS